MDPSPCRARVDLFLRRGTATRSVSLLDTFPLASRFRVDLFVATKVASHLSSFATTFLDPLVSPNDVLGPLLSLKRRTAPVAKGTPGGGWGSLSDGRGRGVSSPDRVSFG